MWAVQLKKKKKLRAGYGVNWLQKYTNKVPPEYKEY
jgi:hypothetical protein